MIETDRDRLAVLGDDREEFDTGRPTRMWALFDEAYLETDLDRFTIANREPVMTCRSSDVAEHELVKQSRVTRVKDGAVYFVKDFEPDGTGMTIVRLRK